MNASKKVTISVLVYVVLFAIMYFTLINSKSVGGDAAGNALSNGLVYLLGLGVSFIIAIIFTIINVRLIRSGSSSWIHAFVFVPILLPLLIYSVDNFAIDNPEQSDNMELNLQLTLEIRSSEKIDSALLTYISSEVEYSRQLIFIQDADNLYYDELPFTLDYETDRKFIIRSGNFETKEYYFELGDALEPFDYSDWIPLNPTGINYSDSLKIEFRYKAVKTR